jgi:zinc transporter ZupT
MPEATRFWSWRRWLPDVGAAFSRFPPAVLLAGFLTLFKLSTSNPSEIEDRILGTLAASFLWVLAVDLFVEPHRRPQRTQVIAWLAGTAIALLCRFQWEVWFLALLLFGALILAVGLSGHVGGKERNECRE